MESIYIEGQRAKGIKFLADLKTWIPLRINLLTSIQETIPDLEKVLNKCETLEDFKELNKVFDITSQLLLDLRHVLE